ncbi:pumilio homolog 15-like [Henckelia pumila]|uniref:pumilio homolog 15-like n=1 Tax=Henckelia pumila TaxID=405737 RepID=UPI003C6E5163
MERKIPQNLYLPSSQPPEHHLPHPYRHPLLSETFTHNPLFQNSDISIESAFSNLTISPDFRSHGQMPSSLGPPPTHDGVSSPNSNSFTTFFGENQQPAFRAWAHSSNNGGANGPSFLGAHQDLHVGPKRTEFYGSGPFFAAGDHPLKSMYHQRRDFSDAAPRGCEFRYLHGKQLLSRKADFGFPISPSPEQGNFPLPSSFEGHQLRTFCSPRASVYNKQHLGQWQQELTVENLRGKIVPLARDQLWSDILKLKLEEGMDEREIETVLSEVMEFLYELMKNQFGSQFFEKLFVFCNEEQRTRIIFALTKFPFKLINVCVNSNGAKAMNTLLEKLTSSQQISLVMSALSPAAIALANDPSGQHVLIYCVKHFSGEYNEHLLNEIADNCLKLATNRSGCCVLQSCVENHHGEARERLISVIIANAVHLAGDPFGNYVVQHLLGLRIPEVAADLYKRFQGYFASLSCNKYASNVVEKILFHSGEMFAASITMELLTSPYAAKLLVDPFGNFVIQSALKNSKGHAHDALRNLIQVNTASMQSNLYGRKILEYLEKSRQRNA